MSSSSASHRDGPHEDSSSEYSRCMRISSSPGSGTGGGSLATAASKSPSQEGIGHVDFHQLVHRSSHARASSSRHHHSGVILASRRMKSSQVHTVERKLLAG